MTGRYVLYGTLSFIGILVLAFGLELLGLQWTKFFAPRRENIRREVFEETKSYTHGAISDLAQYFEQYQKATTAEDKETIRAVVKARFAEFDETNITVEEIRNFLINMRGY